MQHLSPVLMVGQNGQANPSFSLIFMLAIILVMWLFLIRPQAKKAKLQKQFSDSIKVGDKIVTIAGIHGRVNKINDDNTLQIEIAPSTYMTIERSAVSMEYTQEMQKRSGASQK
ncbi:preprotein translocase subunit YajC [Thermoflavifilum sp.]|jgi:preprotein translocase subunit YajC|uniref:preprotein translocase subunit YajC n=1 Tax=Thermoflavifilum sp. TaxID=1968839 RepID=UPI0025D4078F|nr:preprotein translocase subunit YajC [Thermoflavifilum sp.]